MLIFLLKTLKNSDKSINLKFKDHKYFHNDYIYIYKF